MNVAIGSCTDFQDTLCNYNTLHCILYRKGTVVWNLPNCLAAYCDDKQIRFVKCWGLHLVKRENQLAAILYTNGSYNQSHCVLPCEWWRETGHIRLPVSTVNRTYELSGITQVTPFRKYGKHSTCNNGQSNTTTDSVQLDQTLCLEARLHLADILGEQLKQTTEQTDLIAPLAHIKLIFVPSFTNANVRCNMEKMIWFDLG